MDLVTLALAVTPVGGGVIAYTTHKVIAYKNRFKVDPHVIRALEQKNGFDFLTECEDENCSTCHPKPLSTPPRQIKRDDRGYSRNKCKNCGIHLVSATICAGCKKELDDTKARSEKFKAQLAAANKHHRWVDGYRVSVPIGVPDYAAARTDFDAGRGIVWVIWKWTDSDGNQRMFKSIAPPNIPAAESYDIMADGKPIQTVEWTPPLQLRKPEYDNVKR